MSLLSATLSGRDRHFEDVLALVGAYVVSLLDLLKLEAVRRAPARIETARRDHRDEATHAFLPAWASAAVVMTGIFIIAVLYKPETRVRGTVGWVIIAQFAVYLFGV
ncbi:hypothetical protein [Bradyrhizobium yuanmingense]|uniref:hypothetical protein n=1 Tax=Bradyrhizobium yuanmingense TaxID=108015 RepID=UPI0012FE6E65